MKPEQHCQLFMGCREALRVCTDNRKYFRLLDYYYVAITRDLYHSY